MANRGYQSSQQFTLQDLRKEVYGTYQKTHMGRGCSDIVQHGIFEVESIVSTAIAKNIVTLPANSAMKGHILQNETTGFEFNVVDVNGNDVTLEQNSDAVDIGVVGDSFSVKQFVMSKLTKDGGMQVTVTPAAISFLKDTVTTTVSEDTVTPASTIPLPTKILDDNGINVDKSLPLAAIRVDAGVTGITVAGTVVGVLASAGKRVQLSSNADDVALYVNAVLICVCLAGSPINLKVNMAAGNIELRSLTGVTISAGNVGINIVG